MTSNEMLDEVKWELEGLRYAKDIPDFLEIYDGLIDKLQTLRSGVNAISPFNRLPLPIQEIQAQAAYIKAEMIKGATPVHPLPISSV